MERKAWAGDSWEGHGPNLRNQADMPIQSYNNKTHNAEHSMTGSMGIS